MDPFVEQVVKWLGQHACVHMQREPSCLKTVSSGHLICKTTIEPTKPSLCYNARPLAGVMKRVLCRMGDFELYCCERECMAAFPMANTAG